MYTLVVIDMQETFPASSDLRTQKNITREIKMAMRKNAAILYVEYKNYGQTLDVLTNVTNRKKYSQAYHVIKTSDDGGQEISQAIIRRKLPKRSIKVCGVNTDYCVASSVEGLTKKLITSKIEVIGDACNSDDDHDDGIEQIKKMPNVRVNKGHVKQ